MTISLSPARPFAALTALAVIAAGVAFAPVATASAASASSQATSVVSKINSYRSSAKLAKLKTQNDITEFVNDVADALAARQTTDIDDIDFDDIHIFLPFPSGASYQIYRVSGGSSTVISTLSKKLKAGSSKADKTGVYGEANYTGVGLQKRGKYTYAFAIFGKFTDKLQDSTAPKIAGTAAVGKTLKVTLDGWKVGGGQVSYQWLVDGETFGTSNTPLVITAELVGKRISAFVSVYRDGYYSVQRRTGNTAKVALGTLAASPTPKVTGNRVVGEVLTAVTGTWPGGTELTYQWKRNGVGISGAKSNTYEQSASDLGKKITVSVKGTKPGYTTVTRTSATPSATLGAFDAPVPTISVTGETVGSVFTVSVGTWTPKASTYGYQWYRDGVAISKATARNYTTVAADTGKNIAVKVTGKKTGYQTASRNSATYLFGVVPG